jgi:hypothetical protein
MDDHGDIRTNDGKRLKAEGRYEILRCSDFNVISMYDHEMLPKICR